MNRLLNLKRALPGLALMLISILVYFPALEGEFISDDHLLITENELVQQPNSLAKIWFSTSSYDYYPLSYSAFWLQWRLFGDNPFGYHVVTLAFHLFSALLLWKLFLALELPGAWWAALCFAIHPLNVSSAAWICELKNTLSLFLMLLAGLLFIRAEASGWKKGYIFSIIAFLLSLLAKISTAMLAPVLLLFLWWKKGEKTPFRDYLRLAPFFGLALVLGLISTFIQHRFTGDVIQGEPESLITKTLNSGFVVWFYIGKTFWPTQLSWVYPKWELPLNSVVTYLPLAGLLVVFAAGVYGLRRFWGRHLLFAFLSYLALLFPVMGFLNITFFDKTRVADHWNYHASIGLIGLSVAAVFWFFAKLTQNAQLPRVFCAGLVAICALISWKQARIYKTEDAFWQQVRWCNPNFYLGYSNYAISLTEKNRDREAIPYFLRAMRLAGDRAYIPYNLANSYLKLGMPQAAIPCFEKAIAVDSKDWQFHLNLAVALLQTEQNERAQEHLQQALKLNPNSDKAHLNLGNVFLAQQRYRDGLKHLERAVQLAPRSPIALNSLAEVKASCPETVFRDGKTAVLLAEKACVLTKYAHPQFIVTLADAYVEAGDLGKAGYCLEKAAAMLKTLSKGTGQTAEKLTQAQERLKAASQPPPIYE